MSDVRCAVCGEPWDQWGANHGDMAWWQYDLFKAGAGCPACEGDIGQHANMDALDEHLRDVVMSSEDPDEWNRLIYPEVKPEWKEPDPKKLWECAGCHVQAVISNEAPYDGAEIQKDDIWLQWHGGDKVHYQNGCGPFQFGDLYRASDPEREPLRKIADLPYCHGCTTVCYSCGKILFDREQPDDCNDLGAAFSHPDNAALGSVCLECKLEIEEEIMDEELS